jgi:DNA-binding transcriptional MerR regulator/methylmalonyl-CoA mutase cobalamin-binding subunit
MLSIAAVERDTGLSKDTLRVWERRYGFPRPQRDAFGERIYPLEQVDRLRLLKRLMDQGNRPGKIIGLDIEALQQLAQSSASAPVRAAAALDHREDLDALVELVKQHRVDALRGQLSQAVLRLGLARFVIDVIAPMNERVGDAWARGSLKVFEEHLYTEAIQGILRNAISTIPAPADRARPRVLLTTLPQEPHGLGVLMAEAVIALEGGRCISLGVQTPLWEVVLAATAQQADIVALSFSAALNPNHVLDSLAEIRGKLPEAIEIWAGGSCPTLHRRPPRGVRALRTLDEVAPALAHWRLAHPTA